MWYEFPRRSVGTRKTKSDGLHRSGVYHHNTRLYTIMTNTQKSYFHRGGLEPLLGATIPEHFEHIAEKFTDNEAVVSIPQNHRLNYAQLQAAIKILARGLLAMGFKKGDRIGIWSANNIEWLLVQMATAYIGAILVNINPAYRSRELAYAWLETHLMGEE